MIILQLQEVPVLEEKQIKIMQQERVIAMGSMQQVGMASLLIMVFMLMDLEVLLHMASMVRLQVHRVITMGCIAQEMVVIRGLGLMFQM